MLPTSWILNNGYEFKIVDQAGIDCLKLHPNFKMMDDELCAPPLAKLLGKEEMAAHQQLRAGYATIRYHLAVYWKSEWVAFTSSLQLESANLHMAMSWVHPHHRRKGIYQEMLRATLEYSKAEGFQTVDSYHRVTNNPVIIAKLKMGFTISGMTLSDVMGCMVRLTYFHNPERRKLQDVRSGIVRPDPLLRELFF